MEDSKSIKSDVIQTKVEPELRNAFEAACKKRVPKFKPSDVHRFLIIHFTKNPDMKFDI